MAAPAHDYEAEEFYGDPAGSSSQASIDLCTPVKVPPTHKAPDRRAPKSPSQHARPSFGLLVTQKCFKRPMKLCSNTGRLQALDACRDQGPEILIAGGGVNLQHPAPTERVGLTSSTVTTQQYLTASTQLPAEVSCIMSIEVCSIVCKKCFTTSMICHQGHRLWPNDAWPSSAAALKPSHA